MIVYAPAKINLSLEVLGKREDGYHEIVSVMQIINLCDVLHFRSDREVSLGCNAADLVSSDNLVIRAARLLQEMTGCRKGATIFLDKQIPPASGLGGGRQQASSFSRQRASFICFGGKQRGG